MKAVCRKSFGFFLSSSVFWVIAYGLASPANSDDITGITGQLFDQTAGTPLPSTSLENIWVKAYLEDPADPGACNSTQEERWYSTAPYNYWCSWCSPEREVTEYFLWGLPVGTYYLRTAEGWWGGDQDCNNASPITVTEEWETIIDKDFIINPGAVLSGTLYNESGGGPPVTGMEVLLYKIENNDPCTHEAGWPLLHSTTTQFNSFYSIPGVPAGEYVLKTDDESGSYINAFYTSLGGTTDCNEADVLSVIGSGDTLTGKDFFLEEQQVIPSISPIYLLLLNNKTPVTGY